MALFTREDRVIVINNKPEYIQRILDYDYIIRREPSVVAIVHNEDTLEKLFYGSKEILVPVYRDIHRALAQHRPTVAINLSSYRSVVKTTEPLLRDPNIRVIVIVAEGVPERDMKSLIKIANQNHKTIVGPATFGAITVGALRAGVVGGDYDNILKSRLYSPGSIGIVTRSGGLLNEMFRIVSRNSDGVLEGVAVGGDVFPGSTILDHVLRMNNDPEIRAIVMVSEIGGKEEYEIARLIREGKIRKPIISWVVGVSAELFPWRVQFGHAAAKANSEMEGAREKLRILKQAGSIVPESFGDLERVIREVSDRLELKPREAPYNPLPMDFRKAVSQGLVRRPTSIVSSISKEVDGEISYRGKRVSDILSEGGDIVDVIGYLWFGKQLSPRFRNFLSMCIVLLADHGPHVSGAHNAIVAARAGKDLVSSLASGILTIGPRFGGAIDDAMRYFYDAVSRGISAQEFVEEMKSKGINIPGIGHRVKSKYNPDRRVQLLIEFARRELSSRKYLEFALEVERETLKKSEKLILNVDGAIAAIMLDILDQEGYNIEEMLGLGYGNAIFVLARSVGIIGHILDQKRLKQPLYRHPDDDVYLI
ncbi:MAG: ATP citrate synthase [Candidatus Micrarchaeota archaeon]|nr:ATP citrate synthase [Candidatus Micrarchaeota archaeon]